LGESKTIENLPIYAVTVASFHDRHKNMSKQAEKYRLSIEYILNFDIDQLTESDLARVDSSIMPIPSISCVLKHIDAQRRMVDRGQSMCLLLEDDVILFDNFSNNLNQIVLLSRDLDPGWLIFLGGADNKIDSRYLDSSSLRLIESPISTAEAYLLDFEGCRKRLEWLAENKINLPADHLLAKIDASLGIRQYRPSIPMAAQGSITGLYKTTLDSNRGKHGSIYLKLRYIYNRFRRQIFPRFINSLIRGHRF
jgi:glycosyl transferase, family 25